MLSLIKSCVSWEILSSWQGLFLEPEAATKGAGEARQPHSLVTSLGGCEPLSVGHVVSSTPRYPFSPALLSNKQLELGERCNIFKSHSGFQSGHAFSTSNWALKLWRTKFKEHLIVEWHYCTNDVKTVSYARRLIRVVHSWWHTSIIRVQVTSHTK